MPPERKTVRRHRPLARGNIGQATCANRDQTECILRRAATRRRNCRLFAAAQLVDIGGHRIDLGCREATGGVVGVAPGRHHAKAGVGARFCERGNIATIELDRVVERGCAHVAQAFAKPEEYYVIKTADVGPPIVLARKAVLASTENILKRYGIASEQNLEK